LTVLENGRVGIGENVPTFKLQVNDSSNLGLRVQSGVSGGTLASFGDKGSFQIDANGSAGGRFTVLENGNVGIGAFNPGQKLTVSGTGIVRALVNSDSNGGFALSLGNQSKWSMATVTGGNFQIFNDAIGQNALWIDNATNNVGIGTPAPGAKLEVSGNEFMGLIVTTGVPGGVVAGFGQAGDFLIANQTDVGGRLRILEDGSFFINAPPALPTLITNTSRRLTVNGVIRTMIGGIGVTPLCYNTNQEIAACVSSIRYKTDVRDFTPGLDLIQRLRPVSFNWKQNGMADLGLIAEEVAKEEPLLATYAQDGSIQGVKYDRVGVVLINAVKEQQSRIDRQQALIETQQRQIEALKKLVCAANPTADLCAANK